LSTATKAAYNFKMINVIEGICQVADFKLNSMYKTDV